MFGKNKHIDTDFSDSSISSLGDEKEFESVFKKYYPALCQFARTYLREDEASADLVQDCFLKLWESGALTRKQDHLQSFLYAMVRNGCIDLIRRKAVREKRVGEHSYLVNQWDEEEIDEVTRTETIRQLHAALEMLPDDIREVVKLHYFKGKKYTAIASELNTTYSTIAQKKDRGIKALKRLIIPAWILIMNFTS